MRPTFMSFEAMKSAVFTNQKSIDIVGHNLSNVNTVGYTRQRVDRASIAVQTQNSRVGGTKVGLMGQGVETVGVAQTRDSFLDARFRAEYSNTSYYGQTYEILNDIQTALGDGADITDEAGLYGAITDLYVNLNSFIQEPTMDAQANLVLSAFKNVTQVLNQLDNNLTNVARQYSEDLTVDVDSVNSIINRLAHLNDIISDDSTVLLNPDGSYGPNELLDERNILLDELSSYGDIIITERSDGMIDVTMGGQSIIEGVKTDSLELRVNEDDYTVELSWRSDGAIIDTTAGSLLGAMHHLNGKGKNAQVAGDEPYRGIPYYRDQLDTYAKSLANLANTTLPQLDPVTGGPLTDPVTGEVQYKTLLGARVSGDFISPATIDITAANITISQEWTDEGPGYFVFNPDENVEDYAQELAAKLTDEHFTFISYGEKYVGSFADFQVNLLGTLGSDVAFNLGRQESYAQVSNDFLTQRDSVSGVSSDEETAEMLKYQKSYEAAARVMTTLDEMLDVIINRTGMVGR